MQDDAAEMQVRVFHKGAFGLAAAGIGVKQEVRRVLFELGLQFFNQVVNSFAAAFGVSGDVNAIAVLQVMEKFSRDGAAIGCLDKADGVAGGFEGVVDQEELVSCGTGKGCISIEGIRLLSAQLLDVADGVVVEVGVGNDDPLSGLNQLAEAGEQDGAFALLVAGR